MNLNPNLFLVLLQLPCHILREAFPHQSPHCCAISIFSWLLVLTTTVNLSSVVVYLLILCLFHENLNSVRAGTVSVLFRIIFSVLSMARLTPVVTNICGSKSMDE